MRKAINENRTVQLVLIAILALGGGLFFLNTTKGSGSSSSTAATAATGTSSSGVGSTAAPLNSSGSTTASTASTGTSTGTTSAPASATSASSAPAVPANLLPGSGMPKSPLDSYKHGNAVALLVVRAGGTDDALVRHSLDRLSGVPKLSVYVTRAKNIARYAWLTQGVDVTDLPALVILHPRRLTKGVPTASVSYGFRDGASVLQAAKNALYRGPTHLPYHP